MSGTLAGMPTGDVPVIGVTAIPRREVRAAFGALPHETVPELYLDMLYRAGGAPLVIPAHGRHPEGILDRLDGLLLTGGGDVDPALYAHPPRPETTGVDPDRDTLEARLVSLAVERDTPILAICRGIQILNVALGGTLIQDIAAQVSGSTNHWDLEHWNEPSHPVRVEGGSALHGLVGEEVSVNSIHHQAVDRLGSGLRAVGWAPDGVVEAVEAAELRFCMGLQWHPECLGPADPGFRVFESFVRAAKERSGGV